MRYKKIPLIDTEREIYNPDFIVIGSILVEMIQILFFGPQLKVIANFFGNASVFFTLKNYESDYLINDLFWYHFCGVIGSVAIFAYLFSVIFFKLELRWSHFCLMQFSNDCAQVLVPVLSNLGYLPIISILLDALSCNKSISNNFGNSFMD